MTSSLVGLVKNLNWLHLSVLRVFSTKSEARTVYRD